VERAAQRMIRELGAEVVDSWWDFVEGYDPADDSPASSEN
jgi:hypothetical protein